MVTVHYITVAMVRMLLHRETWLADPYVLNMPEGQMFYTVTYGKGQMGSYASQLSTQAALDGRSSISR